MIILLKHLCTPALSLDWCVYCNASLQSHLALGKICARISGEYKQEGGYSVHYIDKAYTPDFKGSAGTLVL